MTFKTGDPYLISLERKNVFKGYTKENICFICWSLNVSDCSASGGKAEGDVEGCGAWSKAKWQNFIVEFCSRLKLEA